MKPDTVGRYVGEGVVKYLDMQLDGFPKVGKTELVKLHMPAHRQVRTIDLQYKAGGGNRLILRPHRVGQSTEIGLMGRIILVAQKESDHPGRRRRHKTLNRIRRGCRRLQIVEVNSDGIAIPV